MTVLQQYRLWLRRAPAASKAVAAVAAALAVVLLVWLVTPVTKASNSTALDGSGAPVDGSGATPAPGGTAGPATGGAGPTSPSTTGGLAPATTTGGSIPNQPGVGSTGGTGTTTGTLGGSSTGTTGGGPTCPPGIDQGVTSSEVRVAVGLIDIPGVNQSYNIPEPEKQQRWYDLVIAQVNKEGGAGCRKIVPKYYRANQAVAADLEANCKSIIASKPFAYIDDGAYLTSSQKQCFPAAKLLYIGPTAGGQELLDKHYPYIIVTGGVSEQSFHNVFQAFKKYGVYTAAKGFKKEGLIYRSCDPNTRKLAFKELNLAGVSNSQIVEYNLGCPTKASNPADIQQAILKFQREGVTNVALMDMVGDVGTFTRTAQQQRFTPKYAMPDYGYIATVGPDAAASKPDPDNWNGALLAAPGANGIRPAEGPATKWCNSIFTKAGEPLVYNQGAGLGGIICNNLILFKLAADHAPTMKRIAFATGIQSVGKVDYSWAQSPADYSGYHVVHGGQYWRSVTYHKACDCYKANEVAWQDPFK